MKAILFIAVVLLVCVQAHPAAVITPSTNGATSLDSEDYPFQRPVPVRYQQVFDASQFLAAMPSGGFITQASFSSDFYCCDICSTVSNVQVSFSTTAASSSSLSPVFAQNEGADQTLVFSGLLRFGSGSGYSEHVPFSSAFFYDPRQGNLLMEVKNFTGDDDPCRDPIHGRFPGLDAAYGSAIPSGVVFATGANTETGFVGSGVGVLTQFSFTPVPEPATAVIAGTIAVGFACSAMLSHRRKKKREEA